ncbi:MAG: tetratricopeptide repeat protein [Planctomycetes bacterium]|nr:tetratricopeptide repeat protein [Planctomycetota bacterium]MCW8136861.1 tetratricopeptide repeat protein [Planctomycetota bacterium]
MFAHAVARDAAYQLQLPGTRARLHGEVLNILESEGVWDGAVAIDLARHARAAQHDTDPVRLTELVGKELRYALAAAEHGISEYDLQGAVSHCRRVAEHPGADAALAGRAYARCAAALLSLGRPADALAWIERHEHEFPAASGADVLESKASSLLQLGRVRDAAVVCERALEALRDRNGSRESQLLSLLCSIHSDLGNEPAAVAAGDRAIELARAAGEPGTEAQAFNNRARVLVARGKWAEALPLFERAVRLAVVAGNLRTECYARGGLGACQVNTGRLDQAEGELETSAQVARRIGNHREEGVALTNLATIWEWRRNLDRAADYYARSLAVHRESGNQRAEAITLRNLANNCTARGLHDDALGYICKAFKASRACGDVAAEAALYSVLAYVLFSLGRTEGCIAAGERAEQMVAGTGDELMRCASRTYRALALSVTLRMAEALPLLDANVCELQPPRHPRLLVELGLIPRAAALSGLAMHERLHAGSVAPELLAQAASALDALSELCAHAEHPQRCASYVADARNWLEQMRAGGVPTCWFGQGPGGITPLLRLAVLDQLSPELRSRLQSSVPEVLNEMAKGTEGASLPDWRNAALPVD